MNDPRLIAFYLPQFHPIPENNQWWGEGFTEWRRVVQARPLFKGHHQPHLPADLGFYDLRLPEAREAQAELARRHGIHGFCYYHYWFHGKRMLQRPFEDVLATGRPDFPFCLCWANENWTRVWDGNERQILMRQDYGTEDDLAHIRTLIPAFRDRRYIRIDGKPLFLIYRPEDLPDPKRTAAVWRKEAELAGIGGLYLAKVESFTGGVDPRDMGVDGAVEFAPDWRKMGRLKPFGAGEELLTRIGLLPKSYLNLQITDYEFLMREMLGKPRPEYDFFRCVTPGFDNTPRRGERGAVFINSTPERYEQWLGALVDWTKARYQGDRRLIFVNAWNEWGEGNHLEPDQRHGRAFLEATARAVSGDRAHSHRPNGAEQQVSPYKKAYWRGRRVVQHVGNLIREVRFSRSE